jgi:hypothetical protein
MIFSILFDNTHLCIACQLSSQHQGEESWNGVSGGRAQRNDQLNNRYEEPDEDQYDAQEHTLGWSELIQVLITACDEANNHSSYCSGQEHSEPLLCYERRHDFLYDYPDNAKSGEEEAEPSASGQGWQMTERRMGWKSHTGAGQEPTKQGEGETGTQERIGEEVSRDISVHVRGGQTDDLSTQGSRQYYTHRLRIQLTHCIFL